MKTKASGAGLENKNVQKNTFLLTAGSRSVFLVPMNATTTRATRWCWRKDLAEFRGLTDRERTGFLLVLEKPGWRVRTIQDLLGHEDISTTEIYLHVATGANGLGVESPLDGGGWLEELGSAGGRAGLSCCVAAA